MRRKRFLTILNAQMGNLSPQMKKAYETAEKTPPSPSEGEAK